MLLLEKTQGPHNEVTPNTTPLGLSRSCSSNQASNIASFTYTSSTTLSKPEEIWKCYNRDLYFDGEKWACFRCKTELICWGFRDLANKLYYWEFGATSAALYGVCTHFTHRTTHLVLAATSVLFPSRCPLFCASSSQQAECHLCRVGWMVAPSFPAPI